MCSTCKESCYPPKGYAVGEKDLGRDLVNDIHFDKLLVKVVYFKSKKNSISIVYFYFIYNVVSIKHILYPKYYFNYQRF